MSTSTPTFSAETARKFDRYSVANAVRVTEALPCGCEPYVDVFTYKRWQAQGFQVQRGQRAVKLPLIRVVTRSDPDTGEEKSRRVMGRSAVFCRCQVRSSDGGAE